MSLAMLTLLAFAAMVLVAMPAMAADKSPAAMASPLRLEADGWFRSTDGTLFVPLGGFHGNVMPVSLLKLDEAQVAAFKPYLWHRMLDLYDAPDDVLDRWFKLLADNGVTAVRLFPRARVGTDVLDLCGKVNPDLQAAFHRAFKAAKPYGIRFLLQIMPEPGRTGYRSLQNIDREVLPKFTADDLAGLTPSQRRFLIDRKTVNNREFFSDPDVLACQKLYLQRVLEWVAAEEQIFALEIYNEQGWDGAKVADKWTQIFTYSWENEEIRWTAELVAEIKKRLPDMPVCVSHPGFGVSGFDPLLWHQGAKTDFYSTHMYAGLCGESDQIDFAAVTGATSAIIRAGAINFCGEWGILTSDPPEAIRRRNHRQAIWLSLLAGSPGFMQWEYDFPEEYRWPAKVFASLPKGFSPQAPAVALNIAPAYRELHTNTRYSLFRGDEPFHAFAFNKEKQQDKNLQRIFAAYNRSLEIGLPIRFVMGEAGALSLDQFEKLDASANPRPIQAIGGYQATWMKDSRSATCVAFLRSSTVRNLRNFRLAVPVESPLKLKLDLPAGQYSLRLINLDTNEERLEKVSGNQTLDVAAQTSADYVVVLSKE